MISPTVDGRAMPTQHLFPAHIRSAFRSCLILKAYQPHPSRAGTFSTVRVQTASESGAALAAAKPVKEAFAARVQKSDFRNTRRALENQRLGLCKSLLQKL
ncbi:MAG TPA: hypothetical protein VK446_01620 [Methylocystis sp.]|nr:hypothetical protein [Methylocystis sp.]